MLELVFVFQLYISSFYFDGVTVWNFRNCTFIILCRNLLQTLRSFLSPSLFYLFTAGVEVVYFHLITLRHTSQWVGLLWTRDRPVAETTIWQHKYSTRHKHPCPCGIRTHDPSKSTAADLRLRPRGNGRRKTFIRIRIRDTPDYNRHGNILHTHQITPSLSHTHTHAPVRAL
jgi:hypothetical protein